MYLFSYHNARNMIHLYPFPTLHGTQINPSYSEPLKSVSTLNLKVRDGIIISYYLKIIIL